LAWPLRFSIQALRITGYGESEEAGKTGNNGAQPEVLFSLPCAGMTRIRFGGCDLSPKQGHP
jgi:hypothetical protein